MRLNKKKSFGEVFGLDGVAFTQDGRFFNWAGAEVSQSGGPPPYHTVDAGDSLEDGSFEHMPEVKLKAMLNMYGETWVNKGKAIAFLSAKKGILYGME